MHARTKRARAHISIQIYNIMCLYPRFIKNKKFLAYNIRKKITAEATTCECKDYRKLYVPIGCGECYECRRQKAQQWKVRLNEELKVNKHAYFITLTFSNESIIEIAKANNMYIEKTGHYYENGVATIAVRRFLERWRKKHKKSCRHWLITELGHEGTERVHIHGILFTEEELTNEELFKYWKYGRTDIGEYCNERTINYIVKYVTKIDTDHKNYKAVILCSAGLGKNFIKSETAKRLYKYEKDNTPEYYTLKNGNKVALPIYYRNKLFTQEERDNMWTDRLNKHEIYINGIRYRNIDKEEMQNELIKVYRDQQKWNEQIGYGTPNKEWQAHSYNVTLKMLNNKKK